MGARAIIFLVLFFAVFLVAMYGLAMMSWKKRQKTITKKINKAVAQNKVSEKHIVNFLKLTSERDRKLQSLMVPIFFLVRKKASIKEIEQEVRALAEQVAADYPELIDKYPA